LSGFISLNSRFFYLTGIVNTRAIPVLFKQFACGKQLILRLTDGSEHRLNFRFTRGG
jgi:hypothetical protein